MHEEVSSDAESSTQFYAWVQMDNEVLHKDHLDSPRVCCNTAIHVPTVVADHVYVALNLG